MRGLACTSVPYAADPFSRVVLTPGHLAHCEIALAFGTKGAVTLLDQLARSKIGDVTR